MNLDFTEIEFESTYDIAVDSEHYKDLMYRLEKLGYVWNSGALPTEFDAVELTHPRVVIEVWKEAQTITYNSDDGQPSVNYTPSLALDYLKHDKEDFDEDTEAKRLFDTHIFTRTREDYLEALETLEQAGYHWFTGSLPTVWKQGYDKYKEDTLLIINKENKSVYLENANPITDTIKDIQTELVTSQDDLVTIKEIIKSIELRLDNTLNVTLKDVKSDADLHNKKKKLTSIFESLVNELNLATSLLD